MWKIVWWFLKSLKTKLPYDPATPLLGKYPKKLKTSIKIHAHIFIAALFIIVKMKIAQMSINR